MTGENRASAGKTVEETCLPVRKSARRAGSPHPAPPLALPFRHRPSRRRNRTPFRARARADRCTNWQCPPVRFPRRWSCAPAPARRQRCCGRFRQDADQIDHRIRPAMARCHRGAIAHIGLHGLNLPDDAQRLEMAGKIGAAHGDPHPPAALGQRPHQMPPDKTRPAENRDQPVAMPIRSPTVNLTRSSQSCRRCTVADGRAAKSLFVTRRLTSR
jgi:hypothetical protein